MSKSDVGTYSYPAPGSPNPHAVIKMIDGLRFEQGEYGPRAVATGAWSKKLTEYVIGHKIVELELNDGHGWRGDDVSFLVEMTKLLSLTIIKINLSSVDSIHHLRSLRALKVITYCKTEIDFSTFPYLEQCALVWRPKARSLFECSTLKKLFLDRYDGTGVASFATLTNLESLAILNAPLENLRDLAALVKLKSLRLGNLRRLKSLNGIEGLVNLDEIDIDTCRKIGSIEVMRSLFHLKRLNLNNCGNINSLEPLRELDCLEAVTFSESTNILDGNLWPLAQKKKLKRVSFQNRRNYSHRREEFLSP